MATKKAHSSDSKMVSFRLKEEEAKRLDKLVEQSGGNRSQFIAQKCFANTDSRKHTGLTLNYLEKMGSYLADLKNGELKKEEFLENANKELEYLWRSLN